MVLRDRRTGRSENEPGYPGPLEEARGILYVAVLREVTMDDKPYKVYDREGRQVCQRTETLRYSKEIELSILKSGHTIKLHGKRITQKMVNDRP